MPEAKWIDEKKYPAGQCRVFVIDGKRYWVFRDPSNRQRLRLEAIGDEETENDSKVSG